MKKRKKKKKKKVALAGRRGRGRRRHMLDYLALLLSIYIFLYVLIDHLLLRAGSAPPRPRDENVLVSDADFLPPVRQSLPIPHPIHFSPASPSSSPSHAHQRKKMQDATK